jgi:hypothetical protein
VHDDRIEAETGHLVENDERTLIPITSLRTSDMYGTGAWTREAPKVANRE